MPQSAAQRLLHQAHFLTSAARIEQCPADDGLEVAFAGRSNSGKSSAINRITGQKTLARTSRTPGRTRLINFFELDEQRRLVDLPGYGYARVAKQTRNEWQYHLDHYLAHRRCLCGLVLMMDIRHPLKEFDRLLLNWAASAGMPMHILLTKADKLKRGKARVTLRQLRAELAEHSAPLSAQLFSATDDVGDDVVWQQLGAWLAVPETSE